jgi:CRISPR-associated protein Cas2
MKPLELGGEDMFVIVTYDVDAKRCAKVMKYLRQWLEHRQRSVFSGFLTTFQLRAMEYGLQKLIKPHYDNVIIFQTNRADQISEWMTQAAQRTRVSALVVSPPEQRRKQAEIRNRKREKARFRF